MSEAIRECDNCKHRLVGIDSFPCNRCTRNAIDKWEPIPKQTQADKIRAMNDEELAVYLVNFKNTFGEEYEGEMSCLDWLQSEAE